MKIIVSLASATLTAIVCKSFDVDGFFSGWISAVAYYTSGIFYEDIKKL